MRDWIQNYGKLLAEYSLYLKPGELVYLRSTTLAEPLVRAFQEQALKMGARLEVELAFDGEEENILEYGSGVALTTLQNHAIELISNCDAYLVIRAPFADKDLSHIDPERKKKRQLAHAAFSEIYFRRLGDKSLKRSLCQYPTPEFAQRAGMNLDEYAVFIQKACYLDRENPEEHWKALSLIQQRYVDYLNQCDLIRYEHSDWSIECSVKGRNWINSDGKSNMPSGEVFTSPVEDSANGTIFFNYPTMMFGKDVQGIRLEVRQGWIESWSAQIGQDVLDEVFATEGTRRFGEIAIGTNQNIQRATKNILFDEKIGGTVHMAVGQSYLQCGGLNKSSIHWDLITDMKSGGRIFADGKLIYENGIFLI
ncbi:MAG: aminopeptidase [Saprospiraceae bacterium]|nr:aminopeptidase [Saprospiraceae bacterium]